MCTHPIPLPHCALAAFRAFSLRCSGVSFLAEAFPPFRPNSTAAGFFFAMGLDRLSPPEYTHRQFSCNRNGPSENENVGGPFP